MTEVRGGEPEIIAQVLQAALGVAALHFPVRQEDRRTVVAVEHVQYLLDGHVDAWLDWPRLPLGQARQVARLLRHRPAELAGGETVDALLRTLLLTDRLPGCSALADGDRLVGVAPGMPMSDFVDATLDELDALRLARQRCVPVAKPGEYQTILRVTTADPNAFRTVDAHYRLRPHDGKPWPQRPAPKVVDAAALDALDVPAVELLELAGRLDELVDGQLHGGYRAEHIGRLLRSLRQPGGSVGDALQLVAGRTQVLRFDAHLTRLDQRWNGVKNAWVERDKSGLPVLRVAVRSTRTQEGAWSTVPQDHTAEVVEACGLERLTLDPVLPDVPGRVRAIVPRARRHPVGKGLGARFLLRLTEHIEQTLPDLMPLHYEQDMVRLPRRMTEPIAREAVPDAIHAAGFERLRVVCLYQSAAARKRMTTRLDDLTANPTAAIADGDERQIGERLSVVFHRTPELIAHGRHERRPLLDQLAGLNGNDALTAAWIETVWNPSLRVDDDAKHQLRRLLAARAMVSQFLATDPPEVTGRQRRSAAALRHASAFALRDLLRGAGVVDHRLANAASADDLVARLDQPAILVGIHARLQQSGGNGKPRLVVRMVALYADGDPTACWPIKMYSDTHGWRPYAPALADFHAGPIGSTEHGRRGTKAEATRLYVASILDALDPGLPVIIFTDAKATRTIWPGLQNGTFRAGALPGDNLLAAGRDVAIVRCNANEEVPRPVHRVSGGRRPGDPLKPATPARRIYRLADGSEAVWLLPGASRVYRSRGGDAGARYTRWTLPADLAFLRGDDWHGFTGTEIAIVRAGRHDPLVLAALTARLCDQAVAWDDRTRLPTPLHLGVAADQDHPDYRTPDNQLDDESSD